MYIHLQSADWLILQHFHKPEKGQVGLSNNKFKQHEETKWVCFGYKAPISLVYSSEQRTIWEWLVSDSYLHIVLGL